ncbi:MAG: hypothetical protein F6K28_52815 [Microcoleus sp. SIO2G3]|nr:hypothetical protein [Microcoleus sp. SIO2G3]
MDLWERSLAHSGSDKRSIAAAKKHNDTNERLIASAFAVCDITSFISFLSRKPLLFAQSIASPTDPFVTNLHIRSVE